MKSVWTPWTQHLSLLFTCHCCLLGLLPWHQSDTQTTFFFSRLWIIEFMLIWKTIQILISIVPEIFMQILTSSTVSEVYLSWIFHAGQTGRGGLFCLPLLSPKVAVKAEKMTSPYPAHSGNPHLSSKLLSLSKRKNSVTFTNAWR